MDDQIHELDKAYQNSLDLGNRSAQSRSDSRGHVTASVELPPAMADAKQHTADEVIKMMNKVPLFMTELDDTDEQGDENMALEAIKALAYEGSRAEQAENFRRQGNEHARVKHWSDAKEFYARAIAVLKAPPKSLEDRMEEMPDLAVLEIDEEAEAKKEKEIEEASFANRALCHLELSMIALKFTRSRLEAKDRQKTTGHAVSTVPHHCESILETPRPGTAPPQHAWLWTRYQKPSMPVDAAFILRPTILLSNSYCPRLRSAKVI